MIYLHTLIKAVMSVMALFLLTKIIGRRQVSQLSLFDYINGITIGSVAAEIAITDSSEKFAVGIVAMAVYAAVTLLFALISDRSIVLRRFIEGVPIVLMRNGKIYEKNFSRAKLDLNEFLMRCRGEGYFDISKIDTAIFEPNGMMSILGKADSEPVRISDTEIKPKAAQMPIAAVIDGKLMEENLSGIGFDAKYAMQKLDNMNVDIGDVFFASCAENGEFCVYERAGKISHSGLE